MGAAGSSHDPRNCGMIDDTATRCDGCQLPKHRLAREGAGPFDNCIECSDTLVRCPDCRYTVCDDCMGHACANADGCPGRGPVCTHRPVGFGVPHGFCGSCGNELLRRQMPNAPRKWFQSVLPPKGMTAGDSFLHHNLARGTCRCPNSNFGAAYAEMRNGLRCYMGAKGGAPFAGAVKSPAQIDREFWLIERDEQGLSVEGNEVQRCQAHGCDKMGTSRCATCRSVWYCSDACAAKDERRHDMDCGPYMPPDQWLFVSVRPNYRAFHDKHGRYPLDESTTVQVDDEPKEDESKLETADEPESKRSKLSPVTAD